VYPLYGLSYNMFNAFHFCLLFYFPSHFLYASQRLALCLFRGSGGWDWAASRRSTGTREHDFAGINLKPRKVPDCPQGARTQRSCSPTTTPALAPHASVAPAYFAGDRVHIIPVLVQDSVLGGFCVYCKSSYSNRATISLANPTHSLPRSMK
jgi:hypothetical protein